jgi:hypothetical protein
VESRHRTKGFQVSLETEGNIISHLIQLGHGMLNGAIVMQAMRNIGQRYFRCHVVW